MGEYPSVKDSWMAAICSQGSSLLSVDLSGSEVTDSGFALLKDCSNLQSLTYNYCDHVSEHGLKHISGNFSVFMFGCILANRFSLILFLLCHFSINDGVCCYR